MSTEVVDSSSREGSSRVSVDPLVSSRLAGLGGFRKGGTLIAVSSSCASLRAEQIENVLRRYIVEYVTCKTCKSPDTILTKDNRLFFMTCESCGSTRSVSAIKSGFQAVRSPLSRVFEGALIDPSFFFPSIANRQATSDARGPVECRWRQWCSKGNRSHAFMTNPLRFLVARDVRLGLLRKGDLAQEWRG